MFRFPRFVFAPLAALGLLAVATRPAQAGPIWVEVEAHYPLPSYVYPVGKAVGFWVAIGVQQGWYFSGLEFSGLANQNGRSLDVWDIDRSPLWNELYELMLEPTGGGATGYFAGADITAGTQPGVYDREPGNLKSPATVTVYAYNDDGETASASATISFTAPGQVVVPPVSGPVVPEPASALLLGVGLMVPAGAVWLRRRRAS